MTQDTRSSVAPGGPSADQLMDPSSPLAEGRSGEAGVGADQIGGPTQHVTQHVGQPAGHQPGGGRPEGRIEGHGEGRAGASNGGRHRAGNGLRAKPLHPGSGRFANGNGAGNGSGHGSGDHAAVEAGLGPGFESGLGSGYELGADRPAGRGICVVSAPGLDLWACALEANGAARVLVFTPDGVVTGVRGLGLLPHVSAERAVGRRLSALFRPEWARERQAVLDRAVQDRGEATLAADVIDGQEVWFAIRSFGGGLHETGRAPEVVSGVMSSPGFGPAGVRDASSGPASGPASGLASGTGGVLAVGLPAPIDAPMPPPERMVRFTRAASLGPLHRLTVGELEVLRLITLGWRREAMSEALRRTVKAVERRRTMLGRKLGVERASELIAIGLAAGLHRMSPEVFDRFANANLGTRAAETGFVAA